MADEQAKREEIRARYAAINARQRSLRHVLIHMASTFGAGRHIPARIEDHRRGVTWDVLEVLEHIVYKDFKDDYNIVTGLHDEAVYYRLRVHGPLPWAPGKGEQIIIARSYDDGAGWYITPG